MSLTYLDLLLLLLLRSRRTSNSGSRSSSSNRSVSSSRFLSLGLLLLLHNSRSSDIGMGGNAAGGDDAVVLVDLPVDVVLCLLGRCCIVVLLFVCSFERDGNGKSQLDAGE